jgi:hypothetical protein
VTAVLADTADAIAERLQERDLATARDLFDATVDRQPKPVLDAFVRQLAATVTLPPGLIVWGFALDIWANPYRGVDEQAWRCGGCRWTGSHYRSDEAARVAAVQHVAEHHPGGGVAVVSYMDETYWDAVEATEEVRTK